MKIIPILICFLIIILINCAKEYSCENCRETPIDTIRTIPNELITSCDIFIDNEVDCRKIYFEETNKFYPQTYRIWDSILMDGSHLYQRSFNLKNYLDMSKYLIGDTFFVRYEIRWKSKPPEHIQEDTLIY